jgi:hypothetical protein
VSVVTVQADRHAPNHLDKVELVVEDEREDGARDEQKPDLERVVVAVVRC